MSNQLDAHRKLESKPLVPNAETVAAMKEARRGKLQKFATTDDLMAGLNADSRLDMGYRKP